MDRLSLFRSNRVCVILTGASRGFGVALATTLAKYYRDQFNQDNSSICELMFVLLARNIDQLKAAAERLSQMDIRIKVSILSCDLAKEEAIESVEQFFQTIHLFSNPKPYEHYILLHNAGSIGDANMFCKSISINQMQSRKEYYSLNLFSVMELTGLFIRQTESLRSSFRHIINISSLAAIQPFPGLVDYCVGKTAREAYFRALVNELNDDPKNNGNLIRILNYAPGPMKTEMFDSISTNSLVSKAFQKIVPLNPDQSAEKLWKVLAGDSFTNGDHIDFYDI